MNFTLQVKDISSYTLINGTTEIASIKYTAQSQSVRLRSNERRVFFLEEVGLLQNKILLKTEYGVQIGENYYTRQQHKGLLYLSKEKYAYEVNADSINFYNKRHQSIATFRLDKASSIDMHEICALLFSLAWMISNAELTEAAIHKASAPYAS